MRNKILAGLLLLKITILAVWLFTSIDPFQTRIAIAGLPPHSSRAVESKEVKETKGHEKEKGLILAIKHKEDELRERERELAERKGHLLEIKGDIETRIKELNSLLKELRSVKAKIDSFNNGKARRLVKIYESMTPQDAAARIERLDDNLAASIIGSMREKIAGKILGFVNVDKSVRISRVLKKEIS